MRRSRPCPRLSSLFLPWERLPSRRYLPRLQTTLTANAARDLLAVVPGGTSTISAAAEVIETVMRGVLAAAGGVEPSCADVRGMAAHYFELVHAIVCDPCDSGHDLGRLGHIWCTY